MRPLKLFFSAFLVLTGHYLAFTQIQSHGTIVVAYFSDDEIAMAADSRSMPAGTGLPIPNDKQCKLIALGEHMIFASVGATGWAPQFRPPFRDFFLPPFDHTEEAKQAFHSAGDSVLLTARAWKENLVSRWHWINIFDHAALQDAVSFEGGGGGISQGIFAGLDQGQLRLVMVNILFDMQSGDVSGNVSQIWRCTQNICGFGLPDVTVEHDTGATQRAREDNERWSEKKKTISPEQIGPAEAVRMVELTIAESDSAEVGGVIDSIKLDKSGTMQWLRWQENCPKQSD